MQDTLQLDALQAGLAAVVAFIPALILFLVILVIGVFIARMIAKAVDKGLEKVGFDRAVERGGIKRALDRSRFDASDIVSKLVYYSLVLFVLQLAFGVFGPNPISELLTEVITFLPALIVAIVIVVVASAIASAVKTLIQEALSGLSYGNVLATAASAFILFLGIVAALNQIGVATAVTTPMLITVLATIGGVIVVGAGGGLIKPMQARWEGYLGKAEMEVPRMKEEAQRTSGPSPTAYAGTERRTHQDPGFAGAERRSEPWRSQRPGVRRF